MSMTIRNQALYHDRTVQDWHRETFPSDYWAIDLDLIPGLMILHSNGAIVYAQIVGESRKLTREQLEHGISRLRQTHSETCQRRRA